MVSGVAHSGKGAARFLLFQRWGRRRVADARLPPQNKALVFLGGEFVRDRLAGCPGGAAAVFRGVIASARNEEQQGRFYG